MKDTYTIASLVIAGRHIWGIKRLTLAEITIRMTVNVGKLARCARGATKDKPLGEHDRKLALGHIIVSTIRWADDLHLDPDECVKLALEQQCVFAAANPER